MGCCVGTLDNGRKSSGFVFTRSGIESPELQDDYGSVYRSIVQVYPDQPDHLQATPRTKFWQGGADPLDYVSVLKNEGDANTSIPPHWHYISYGFSDIHGDGRVHEFRGTSMPSGFGFELTMRVRCEEFQELPPLWPVHLMNDLAKYVYKSGGVLKVGDHVMWNKPIDGERTTHLHHMLVGEDPQLRSCNAATGQIEYRQIVGVMEAEMKAARQWNGKGVLDLLRAQPWAGGHYLVTNIQRQHSIFHADLSLKSRLDEGIARDGSNLGNVRAACTWYMDSTSPPPAIIQREGEMGEEIVVPSNQLSSVQLVFELQTSEYLPLIVRGRLKKGRHFFFVTADEQLITFIPPGFTDEIVFVNEQQPLKSIGKALQIYCSDATIAEMDNLITSTTHLSEHELPSSFRLRSLPLTITIVHDEDIVQMA